MFAKKCPACGKWSYSAADKGSWICPHCKRDLWDQPPQPTSAGEKENGKTGIPFPKKWSYRRSDSFFTKK
ncbi:MAG: hypothetical protein AB1426_06450 [Bacillota bacterium]